MKKRIISAALSLAMIASSAVIPFTAQAAEAKSPQYQTEPRQMEVLNRGLIAVKTEANTYNGVEGGVYLSWRLLGTESLENQAFDIYRNGNLIHTTGVHDATNWVDTSGTASDTYKVVKAGASDAEVEAETAVTPSGINRTARSSIVGAGTSEKNSYSYFDVPIQIPDDVARMGDGKTSTYKRSSTGNGANDASVGDLDGDGDYEIVLKWDPADSKDSAGADYTGNVYIDAYEITDDTDNLMWRIDLGKNVTAGQHYTQFLVYDFDGDGYAEVAMKTAPGSKDGLGNYVSEVGDTDEIKNVDNEAEFIGSSNNNYLGTGSSRLKGKNPFVQYLTIFDGKTGKALYTTDFIPYEAAAHSDWGDGGMKYNRSERYLAAVAYLDGVHPSIVMCRGYYHDAIVRAYTWDGTELTMQWEHNGSSKAADSLYGQGNHNLSVADVDDDGKDEIVYGSATLDDDGKAIGNTYLGHGDAMHVNDFNNDGVQEVFSVKEDAEGYKKYAMDLRNAATGKHFWEEGKIVTSGDNGRGVMDNIDDAYAKTHPNALAIGWDSGHDNVIDLNGDEMLARPATSSRTMTNFLVYWDGDLGRELLDDNQLAKYYADTGYTVRFYDDGNGYLPASSNNDSKHTPSLVADLWGDWREEIIMPVVNDEGVDTALRIFTSTIPTEYRLTTLMHDSQYRMSVAWQNVGYNQPTHTSYYVGSAALAADENGNELNYLAPEVKYTNVTYDAPEQVAVEGMTLSKKEITLEKGSTETINAVITPDDATKKGCNWESSDTSVATVTNGVVKGVGPGTATITATAKDTTNGTFSDTCEVTVYEVGVDSVTISGDKTIELGIGNEKQLKATVLPDDATDKTVIWKSADTSVAAVSNDGTVTGVSYGKTTVTASTADGSKTAECIVKVKPIDIVDVTGEGAFEFAVENTDEKITLDNNTATSVTLTQDYSNDGAVVQKVFESYSEGKATVQFKYVTGGVKLKDSVWDWDGHEYTMGVKFLDADGNNIIYITQPYGASPDGSKTGAGEMAYKIADGNEGKFMSDWTAEVSGQGNIQGSSKTWLLTAEFDYDNDICNMSIEAYSGPQDGKYTKSFSLDGANFKTLQIYTVNDGAGTIKANPQLSELTYTKTEAVYGNTEVLYERGLNTLWSETDITDWVQTGTETATLDFDSDNGRIFYHPEAPTAEYSAEKTFDVEPGAIVSYDVDWYFGNSIGRDGNINYIQFGDSIRFGWTNGYNLWFSTDGGATWLDSDGDGTADSLLQGANQTYSKNIKAIFNTATGVVSVYFDGSKLGDYTYRATDEFTEAGANSVKFGFSRSGAAPNWETPNGIDRIRVAQFIEGEEPADYTEIKIDSVSENSVNFTYALKDEDAQNDELAFIAAAYDGDVLKSVKVKTVDSFEDGRYVSDSILFDGDISGKNVKLFVWKSLDGMQPIYEAITYTAE